MRWSVARFPRRPSTPSRRSHRANGSAVPWSHSIGMRIRPRCSSRSRSGLPGGWSGYPTNTRPAASRSPSATIIDAIRPPIDLPPAQTGSPSSTPRANAAVQAARRSGSRSGLRFPDSEYRKLNRRHVTPAAARPAANPSRKGLRRVPPAPWARTRIGPPPEPSWTAEIRPWSVSMARLGMEPPSLPGILEAGEDPSLDLPGPAVLHLPSQCVPHVEHVDHALAVRGDRGQTDVEPQPLRRPGQVEQQPDPVDGLHLDHGGERRRVVQHANMVRHLARGRRGVPALLGYPVLQRDAALQGAPKGPPEPPPSFLVDLAVEGRRHIEQVDRRAVLGGERPRGDDRQALERQAPGDPGQEAGAISGHYRDLVRSRPVAGDRDRPHLGGAERSGPMSPASRTCRTFAPSSRTKASRQGEAACGPVASASASVSTSSMTSRRGSSIRAATSSTRFSSERSLRTAVSDSRR